MRSDAAGRRCGPTGRSLIGRPTESIIEPCALPSSSSAWSTRQWQEFCSRRTLLPDDGRKRSSTPVPDSERPWSPARSTPIISSSTPRPGGSSSGGSATSDSPSGRSQAAVRSTLRSRPAQRKPASPTIRFGRSRRSATASRRTTGHLRTRSGRSTAAACSGSRRPDPSRRCSRCPSRRRRPGRTFTFTSASALRRDSIGRSPRWDLRVSA